MKRRDFLLGAYYQFSGGFGVTTNDNYQEAPSLFVQDEFKVAPRFTLTYGLRWEPFFPWTDRYDRLASLAGITTRAQSTKFPDAPPGILFAGDPGVPRGLSPNRWRYFAPRLGFAWDVFGDGRTSLRGGYGIFYDSVKADAVSEQTAPWTGTFQVFNGNASDPFGSVGQTAPPINPQTFGCVATSAFPGVTCPRYPLPLGGLYTGSNLTSPYIQEYNLTLQRQITQTIMVQAGYVGKIAQHVDGWQSFNAARFIPDPVTGAAPSLQNVNDRSHTSRESWRRTALCWRTISAAGTTVTGSDRKALWFRLVLQRVLHVQQGHRLPVQQLPQQFARRSVQPSLLEGTCGLRPASRVRGDLVVVAAVEAGEPVPEFSAWRMDVHRDPHGRDRSSDHRAGRRGRCSGRQLRQQALARSRDATGVSLVDVSTGEFWAGEDTGRDDATLAAALLRRPAEILLPGTAREEPALLARLRETGATLTFHDAAGATPRRAAADLCAHFGVDSLDRFGVGDLGAGLQAAAAALAYLRLTQGEALGHLTRLTRLAAADALALDATSVETLELFESSDGAARSSLFGVLDETITPMGARLLRQWLLRPLLDVDAIGTRQDAVGVLVECPAERARLRGLLRRVGDLERLSSRATLGVAHARDLVGLRGCLRPSPRSARPWPGSRRPSSRSPARNSPISTRSARRSTPRSRTSRP